jgi:hypothetical protein
MSFPLLLSRSLGPAARFTVGGAFSCASFPPPALGECRYRILACCGISTRWVAVFIVDRVHLNLPLMLRSFDEHVGCVELQQFQRINGGFCPAQSSRRASEALGGLAGGEVSFDSFNADGDGTRPIENRNIIGHSAE